MKCLKSIIIGSALLLGLASSAKAQDMDPCASLTETMITVYNQCLQTNTCVDCLGVAIESMAYWRDECGYGYNHDQVIRAIQNWTRLYEGCIEL